ncbi:carboxymethylenebutenolidase [Azospira sp. I13]|uniref:dienelactone hydrolase family protein n=1 Tax=Azospira sp. I13 TaxID=1765050 RepID=UPI000D403810|nr:dienelactone hydrolase family protein [Azospira sp. I13]GBG04039.1 carboxymethylenebutenolidase [Azospira sp. I13]
MSLPSPPPHTTPEFDSLVPASGMDRRTFVTTAIAATIGTGFALAVQPVCAQTQIRTDSSGLKTATIQVPVGHEQLAAYCARPEKGAQLPTVLVVSEIFGVHEYIQDICRRLARQGYLAIAPQLFTRQGDPATVDSIPKLMESIIAKVPDAQVLGDLDACAAWAAKHGGDPKRLAITGFCWGGRITWLYSAHNPAVRAGVAWYGRLVGNVGELTPKHPLDVASSLKTPVLGLYGGQDSGIPLETVEKMRAALKAAGNASEIIVYPDAPHAFHADYRPSYRPDAAADGWQRLLAWLKQHGV